MHIADLIERWGEKGEARTDARAYSAHLQPREAARIEALREMYPGRSGSELMADLIKAALDELEAAMPYMPGPRVIAEDDAGDPIYEDLGPTPRFCELSREILARMGYEAREKG